MLMRLFSRILQFSVAAPLFEYPQTIFVKMPEKTIALKVDPSDSIRHVKRLIEEKEKIPCFKQRLTFAKQQLEDGHSLFHYNIYRESSLQLELSVICVCVVEKSTGRQFTLIVQSSDYVKYLKQLIHDEVGIPPHQQHLQMLRDSWVTLQDSYTLGKYKIKERAVVFLYKVLHIFVKIPTEYLPLTVQPSCTIGYVKQKLEEMRRIPFDQQSLTLNGLELENNLTLEGCNVQNGSTLHLARIPYHKGAIP